MTRSERVSAPTERRNPATLDIDERSALDVLRMLNAEDELVPHAVAAALPELAAAVELAHARVSAGGRVRYFGAGTSGRIGMLDAAELPPTFAVPDDLVVAHHAGGSEALGRAAEGVEDDEQLGAADAAALTAADVAVGLTASGRTPYVAGALRAARAAGAATVLISCHPEAPLGALADVQVAVDTGPEAIAGSTRLKAGTAQKLVLNGFSTALMVLHGRTYSNLMVHMIATNGKLRGRVLTMLIDATGAVEADAVAALDAADGDVRVAIVMLLGATDAPAAAAALRESDGRVRAALRRLGAA